MSREKVFGAFQKNKNIYLAIPNLPIVTELPAGMYKTIYDDENDRVYFDEMDSLCDGIVDLPSKEFSQTLEQIKTFLKEDTKEKFKKYDFLYKRSVLLEGLPGTGKSVLVQRLGKEILTLGGIILFNPNPTHLKSIFTQIRDVCPDKVIMVIFEELDALIDRYEEELLHVLDGELQTNNVMFVATTNYIERIPKRILRPGRFSLIVKVSYPDSEARRYYLKTKISESSLLEEWVTKTEGLSIDELKETVLSVCCLSLNLDDTIERIKEIKSEDNEELQEDKYFKNQKTRNLIATMRELF